MYSTIGTCRVCGNPVLDSLLDLGSQAFSGVFPKRGEAVESGPLELVKCREADGADCCGLVQLRHTFDAKRMYGRDYGYRSGLNASMVAHLHETAENIKRRVSIGPGDLLVDIGSNDSTLLQAMRVPGATLLGVDPTGCKFQSFYPKDIQLIPDFFSAGRIRESVGDRKAKVITSIAMFYDLPAPIQFMEEVGEILADDGLWISEQSYLPMMLEANAYDTICHEHLEYYGLKQVCWAADRAGLRIMDVEFNPTNGGSFAFCAARKASRHRVSEAVESSLEREDRLELGGLDPFAKFGERVRENKAQLTSELRRLKSQGKRVLGYGASTKGNVLLQYCGIGPDELEAIAEVNPDKFGHETPFTHIPIVSEEQAKEMNPDYFLVLPWHFREFIVQKEAAYLARGGALIFPLPRLDFVRGNATAAA